MRVLLLFKRNFSVDPVFYNIAYFSILASGPSLDATITSENMLKRSNNDVVDHLYDASLVLEDFSSMSRIPPIIKCLNSCSLWSSFGWHTTANFSEGPALSIGPFYKVQRVVVNFPYVIRKKEKLPKIVQKHVTYMVKIVRFLVRIISEHR